MQIHAYSLKSNLLVNSILTSAIFIASVYRMFKQCYLANKHVHIVTMNFIQMPSVATIVNITECLTVAL